MTRKIWALAIAVVAALAMSGVPAAARATAASAAPTTAADVGVLINQRQCNVGQMPRQFVIWFGIGGVEGHRCYGGTLGSLPLNNLGVYELFSGGYHGVIDCKKNLYFFKPNQQKVIIDQCQELTILPAT